MAVCVRVQMLSDTNEQNVTDLLPFITMVEVLLEHFTWDEILKEYFCSADPDIVQHRSFSCAGPIGGEVDEEQEAHPPPKRGRNGANRMAFKSTSSWQRMLDSNALIIIIAIGMSMDVLPPADANGQSRAQASSLI